MAYLLGKHNGELQLLHRSFKTLSQTIGMEVHLRLMELLGPMELLDTIYKEVLVMFTLTMEVLEET